MCSLMRRGITPKSRPPYGWAESLDWDGGPVRLKRPISSRCKRSSAGSQIMPDEMTLNYGLCDIRRVGLVCLVFSFPAVG